MLLPGHKENKPLNFQYVEHGEQVGKNSDRTGRSEDGIFSDGLNSFVPKFHFRIPFFIVGRIRPRYHKSNLAPSALRISGAFDGLDQAREEIVNREMI